MAYLVSGAYHRISQYFPSTVSVPHSEVVKSLFEIVRASAPVLSPKGAPTGAAVKAKADAVHEDAGVIKAEAEEKQASAEDSIYTSPYTHLTPAAAWVTTGGALLGTTIDGWSKVSFGGNAHNVGAVVGWGITGANALVVYIKDHYQQKKIARRAQVAEAADAKVTITQEHLERAKFIKKTEKFANICLKADSLQDLKVIYRLFDHHMHEVGLEIVPLDLAKELIKIGVMLHVLPYINKEDPKEPLPNPTSPEAKDPDTTDPKASSAIPASSEVKEPDAPDSKEPAPKLASSQAHASDSEPLNSAFGDLTQSVNFEGFHFVREPGDPIKSLKTEIVAKLGPLIQSHTKKLNKEVGAPNAPSVSGAAVPPMVGSASTNPVEVKKQVEQVYGEVVKTQEVAGKKLDNSKDSSYTSSLMHFTPAAAWVFTLFQIIGTSSDDWGVSTAGTNVAHVAAIAGVVITGAGTAWLYYQNYKQKLLIAKRVEKATNATNTFVVTEMHKDKAKFLKKAEKIIAKFLGAGSISEIGQLYEAFNVKIHGQKKGVVPMRVFTEYVKIGALLHMLPRMDNVPIRPPEISPRPNVSKTPEINASSSSTEKKSEPAIEIVSVQPIDAGLDDRLRGSQAGSDDFNIEIDPAEVLGTLKKEIANTMQPLVRRYLKKLNKEIETLKEEAVNINISKEASKAKESKKSNTTEQEHAPPHISGEGGLELVEIKSA